MGKYIAALEHKLNELFVKNAPFQLPNGLKKFIGEYAWIFVIIITLIYLGVAVAGLFGLLFFGALATAVGSGIYVLFALIALVAVGAETVLYGMAIVPLKDRIKRGWDLLFYANLLGVAYTLLDLIKNLAEGGLTAAFSIFGLFWSSLMVVISFYILFQVRSEFLGKKHVEHQPSHVPKV